MGKGAVIGGSVGSFLAGTILTGLLGLYFAERRLRKHSQAGNAEWRTELPSATYIPVPQVGSQAAKVTPKYEMEGQGVLVTH